MFKTRDQNLVIGVLIVSILLILTTALFLLKPKPGIVLAQGGGDGEINQASNYRDHLKNSDLSDIIVTTSLDASFGGNIGPQSDGSGIEIVPSGAFRHAGDNADGWLHYYPLGYIRNNSASQACFMAPTYPPDGATLTGFAAAVFDNSGVADIGVGFYRVLLTNTSLLGGADLLATAYQPGLNSAAAVVVTDPSITGGMETVSKAYSYYVAVCLNANTGTQNRVYGAAVSYTLP